MSKQLVVKRDEAMQGYWSGKDGQGGQILRFMIDKETSGAERFAMMVNEIMPGTVTGAGVHSHDTEHAFYILRGRGQFILGDEEYIVEPHTSVFIPGNLPHKVTNVGDEPLQYVVLYVPQGPEQDLRRRFAK
jgi:mannose-6-phosphate isomerase-like protein (cupin superfamily)